MPAAVCLWALGPSFLGVFFLGSSWWGLWGKCKVGGIIWLKR